MAHAKPVSDEQLHTLALIGRLRGLDGFYLAGGTAAAFHLGHRTSLDLDLFSRRAGIDLENVRRALVEEIENVEIIVATDVTVQLRIEGSPVDIVSYPYPPLEDPAVGPAGFPVASLIDLSSMKLAAIAKRGLRRDFWDLYEILARTNWPLRHAFDAYSKKFGQRETELYYLMRSLTYFEDADKETIPPRGMSAALWEEIKTFFGRLAREGLE
jgi:hypothetical protein